MEGGQSSEQVSVQRAVFAMLGVLSLLILQKCCPYGKGFVDTSCTVLQSTEARSYVVHLPEGNATVHAEFADFTCPYGMYYLAPELYPQDAHFILPNGSLFLGDDTPFSKEQYCLEELEGKGTRVFLCLTDESNSDSGNSEYKLFPIGLLSSVPFLLVTFLVYSTVTELRSMHAYYFSSHCFSLLCANIFLACVQLFSSAAWVPDWLCVFFGKNILVIQNNIAVSE